jgi:GxxExxY protein
MFVIEESSMPIVNPQMPERGAGYEHDPLSEAVIKWVFTVANTLGAGFLEKVYENALAHEMRKADLRVDQQVGITVHYDSVVVGNYMADLIVEGRLLLEIKACKALEDIHVAQCLNYLKATRIHTSLLINFGTPKPQIRRLSL